MKRKLVSALCIAFILTSTSACKKEQPTPAPLETYAVMPQEDADSFYTEMQQKESVRPIAVMIDNDSDKSRPQIGLEHAYMVYEIVVEGKATRLMALFKDYTLEKVGPVRSSRHYFLDYALENGAIYAHAGWSPKAAKDIASLGVENINGVAADGSCFWRDNTYDKTWHNLYTGTDKLATYAKDKKKYSQTAATAVPLSYNKQDTPLSGGSNATEISLPYASFYKLTYMYNENTKSFDRYVNGKPHASQTGEIFSAKNIILYQLENKALPDTENKGRQDLNNIGRGTGYYLTDGKVTDIVWEKESRSAQTRYTYPDGTPLQLNPGITYVQIVPTYTQITISNSENAAD